MSAFRSRAKLCALALMGADGAALAVAFVLASLAPLLLGQYMAGRSWTHLFDSYFVARLIQVLGFAAALILWFLRKGHYGCRPPGWIVARQIVLACLFAMLCDGFLQFGVKHQFSRLWLVDTWLLAIPFLLVARHLVQAGMSAAGRWAIPVLVAGSDGRATQTAALLEAEAGLGYRVVGCVDLDHQPPSGWRGLCAATGAEMVALAAREVEVTAPPVLAQLALQGIPFVCIQTMTGLPVLSLRVHPLMGSDTVLLLAEERLDGFGRLIKAAFDRAVAVIVLTLLLPAAAVAALWIIRDGGPALYRHRRIGLGGRSFDCLKLRTMVVESDRRLAELLAHDPRARADWAAHHKLSPDPRVTRFGRFLRAYSLDELPQLVNVLRGEMSLVGPRPVEAAEIARFGDHVDYYHRALPGMTGLWQINPGSLSDYARRIHFNTWYSKNWSLWLDMVILARTIPVVLRRRDSL